jgi:hypothetical protein
MFNCRLAKVVGYCLLTLAAIWRCPAVYSASWTTSELQSDMAWRSNALPTSLASESEDQSGYRKSINGAELEYLSKKECKALIRGLIPPGPSVKKSALYESSINSVSRDYAQPSLGRSPPFCKLV